MDDTGVRWVQESVVDPPLDDFLALIGFLGHFPDGETFAFLPELLQRHAWRDDAGYCQWTEPYAERVRAFSLPCTDIDHFGPLQTKTVLFQIAHDRWHLQIDAG